MYEEITGKKAPSTPVSASSYTSYGYPWFDYYDENSVDIEKSETLSKIKTIQDIEKEKNITINKEDSQTIQIPSNQVLLIKK